MGFGVSLFLITLGAIFRFAVSADLIGKSVNIQTIGVILMIVGGASLLLQLVLAASSSGSGNRGPGGDPGHLYDGEKDTRR